MSFARVSTVPGLATAGLLLFCLPLISSLSRSHAKSSPLTTLPPNIRMQTEALVRAWMPQYAQWQLHGAIDSFTPYNCDVQVLTPDGIEIALYKWNLRSNSLSTYVRNDAISDVSATLTARQAVRIAAGWMVALHETTHLSDWRVVEQPQMGASVWRIRLQSLHYNAMLWIDASSGQLRQYEGGLLSGSGVIAPNKS